MANYNLYALDPKGNPIFTPDGKPDLKKGDLYVSVSQVLSMEGGNDFLIPWALNMFGGLPSPTQAYKEYMEKVSDLGTRLHHYIECDLKGEDYPFDVTKDMVPGIESWIAFRKDHDIETVDSEKILFSKSLRIAGTLDARLKVDGKLYVVDLKTGSVMPKAFTQLTIYKKMLMEMGLSDGTEDLLVLGGGDSKSKIADGGKVYMHTIENFVGKDVTQEELFASFMCLRHLWFMKNVKSRKFDVVIKGMKEALDPMVERFKAQFRT